MPWAIAAAWRWHQHPVSHYSVCHFQPVTFILTFIIFWWQDGSSNFSLTRRKRRKQKRRKSTSPEILQLHLVDSNCVTWLIFPSAKGLRKFHWESENKKKVQLVKKKKELHVWLQTAKSATCLIWNKVSTTPILPCVYSCTQQIYIKCLSSLDVF